MTRVPWLAHTPILTIKERAFQWLNKAYDDHFLLFIKAAQCFDSLHGDPRYTQILRKMGLPE